VLALGDWLRSWQVPAVVMEATSVIWKRPFYRLEAEEFECVLADAGQVKNLPGRRSGTRRIRGGWRRASKRCAVTACFVAAPEFRVIRLHTRYRRDLIAERTCWARTGSDGLAQIADAKSQDAAAGRLSQVINRWIYTACLVFGLTWPTSSGPASPTPTRSTRPNTAAR
jgi:hypothetical protein